MEGDIDMQMTATQWFAPDATEPRMEPHSFADVDDSSADSFPASDPPSWASMRVGAPRERAAPRDLARSP
jgi:hypothetical protein